MFLLCTGLLLISDLKYVRTIDNYAIQLVLNKLIKSGYKVIKNDPWEIKLTTLLCQDTGFI